MQKDKINGETALFLDDFAENYSFVIQDEIQSFHWSNNQCSLHPIVIYYREGEVLKHKSYCALSDNLLHDVPFPHSVIKLALQDLKQMCPQIQEIFLNIFLMAVHNNITIEEIF